MIDLAIPLDYWQAAEVDEAECDKPEGQINDCMLNCQTSFASRYEGDLSDLCYTEEPDVSILLIKHGATVRYCKPLVSSWWVTPNQCPGSYTASCTKTNTVLYSL